MASKALPMAPPVFEQWCHARALASSTCDYLSRIRGSQPVSAESDAVSAPGKPKRTRRAGEPKPKRYPVGEKDPEQGV